MPNIRDRQELPRRLSFKDIAAEREAIEFGEREVVCREVSFVSRLLTVIDLTAVA